MRSKRKDYRPRPILIDGIAVGDELTGLVEALARNAHDVWAIQRLADGWTFGKERNDKTKKHPCLVDYDDLPESEKAYDRNVVLSTVRAIIALGFTVSKNVTAPNSPPPSHLPETFSGRIAGVSRISPKSDGRG